MTPPIGNKAPPLDSNRYSLDQLPKPSQLIPDDWKENPHHLPVDILKGYLILVGISSGINLTKNLFHSRSLLTKGFGTAVDAINTSLQITGMRTISGVVRDVQRVAGPMINAVRACSSASAGELAVASGMGAVLGYGLVRTGVGKYLALEWLGNKIGDAARRWVGSSETSSQSFQAVDSVFEFLGIHQS